MKSIKIFITITIISITALNAGAQAPGYLGKRFIINYDLYTMLALRNPNENGNSGISSFNSRHVFSVDWVTGLSQSVGMSFHITKSQFDFDEKFDYYLNYNDGWGDPRQDVKTLNYGDSKGDITAYAVGIHTNLYLNQFIAPLGVYFKPELLFVIMNASFDINQVNKNLEKNTMTANETINIYPKLANESPYYSVALGATIGTHYIFLNRLIFDIGFQLGLMYAENMLSSLKPSSSSIDGSSSSNVNETNYIKVSAQNRMMNQYFLNINAGLGILIF
jgi:hypothetical protein